MEYEEHASFEPISIARGRQILGEEAEGLCDADVERILRHADTLAHVVIDMFLDERASME